MPSAVKADERPASPSSHAGSVAKAVVFAVGVLLVVYVLLYLHTGRAALIGPSVPKPHVVATFTGTVTRVSVDSTEGCVHRPGHDGDLCAAFYAHQDLSVGERLRMSEVIVPTGDGNVGAVLVINATP